MLHIAVDKTVFPQPGKHIFQVVQLIGSGQLTIFRYLQILGHPLLIGQKQLEDNRLLIFKVVVEIPRRDFQPRSDMVGGNRTFALLVKHAQGGIQNSLFCTHSHSH